MNTIAIIRIIFVFIFAAGTSIFPQWVQTNGPYGGHIRCLAVSGTNIFAGTDGSGVFLSTNNGTNWIEVNSGLPNTYIRSLAVSGTNIFAGTSVGVFLSTNNGTSWTEVNSGLPNNTFTTIRSLAFSGTNIFAESYGEGVFLSTNNGTSWTEVNSGLTDYLIQSLAVSGTNIFVGTHERGVWLRPLSEVTTSVEQLTLSLPTKFNLAQNYPNPFNPVTIIQYSIPQRSDVTLKVYDVLGNEAATLVDEFKPAGSYEVEFNARSLSSGIYFYKLQSGSFVETKKMILMR